MGPTTEQIIRLDLPSSMQHVYLLDTIILEILKEMEFDEETSEQVTLAVIEAGTNAIKHGNKEDLNKSAHFEFIVQPDKLTSKWQNCPCILYVDPAFGNHAQSLVH